MLFPTLQIRHDQAVAVYNNTQTAARLESDTLSHSRCYYSDLLAAHEAAGLVEVQVGEADDRLVVCVSLVP